MKPLRRALGALGVVLALCPGLRAEVELQGVRWQRLARARGQAAKPVDAQDVALIPGQPLKGRLLGRLRLLNRGAATEGILLIYVVSAKIAPLRQPQQAAAWALPFMREEKRVPKIGANAFFETALDPTALTDLYLRKVYRAGYWPQELKLQVMLEPRLGAAGAPQILEAALPVKGP